MTIVDFNQWKAARASAATLPALECPRCDAETPATGMTKDGSTVYRCIGKGHAPLTWRIDVDGNMLRGLRGNRFY